MATFGRQAGPQIGTTLGCLADGGAADWKVGGITVDWSTVAAVNADTTVDDGVLVENGQKYLRYGQVLTEITATGKYGPYDPDASDGRQTLTRGKTWVLNRTVKELDKMSDHPAVFDGGTVFKALIRMTTGTHTLADGPTVTEFQTVFPRIGYAEQ